MRKLVLATALALATTAGCDCNGGGSGTVDADGDGNGDSDADVDADPNVRGQVIVRVVDRSDVPLAGMHVVFIDADQTVTHVTTDSAGAATANVFPGASVTAIRARDTGGAFSLTTVLSLVPGDDIELVSAAPAAASNLDPFSTRAVPLPSSDVSTAIKSGSNATLTTLAPHGLVAGDRVLVADVSIGGYNGLHTVASATATTFTVALGGGGLGDGAGGTAVEALPFTVNYAAFNGAAGYSVHTPCDRNDVGTSTSPEVMLRAGCSASTIDLVVVARSAGGAPLAWTQQTAVTVTSGGSTTIADTWHPVAVTTATYMNPTTQVSDVELARFVPSARGVTSDNASGCFGSEAGCVGNGPLALTVPTSHPAKAVMKTRLTCPEGTAPDCVSSSIGEAMQTITHVVDGTQTSYSLDIATNLLPWISAIYNPTTTTIDITETGSGGYDLFEANLRYTRGQVIYTWRVFGGVAADVVFPTLPSSVPGDPTVRPTDVQSAYQVFLCESDAIAGYRKAIENPYHALATCDASASPTGRPFGGTLNRLSQWN